MVELKDRGFILRVTKAQEADVVVKILTSNGEKIEAFAKAGLKSRKRFAGALQPFLNIEFRATKRPQSQLFYLDEASIKHEFKITEIEKLVSASYAAELIEHSAQEGLEHKEIYNLFGALLRALESGLPAVGVLRQFEVKLLSLLGWLPSYQDCGSCGGKSRLSLNAHLGQVLCENCGHYPILINDELKGLLNSCLQTSLMQSLMSDTDAKKVARFTEALLASHWGTRPIKSAAFLRLT